MPCHHVFGGDVPEGSHYGGDDVSGLRLVGIHEPAEPEIPHLRRHVIIQQNICTFEVSVHDLRPGELVEVREAVRGAQGDGAALLPR